MNGPSSKRNPNPPVFEEELEELLIDGDWSCEVSYDAWYGAEGWIEETECKHKWKLYTGLFKQFLYCEYCDIKKKED